MKRYRQINHEERVKIAQMKQSVRSISEIALALNRSKSTISRELRRNQAPPGEYWPDTAQQLTLGRRRRGCILDRHEALREYMMTKLCCHYWTPEQISGDLKHRQNELPSVSHETIYSWIYEPSKIQQKLWKFLPRHKARRGLRKSKGTGVSRIPNRTSIHKRPKVIEKKKQFGHWEGDLMAFKKNSQHILVLRERKTMFTFSIPLDSKKALETSQKIIELMKNIPKKARRSITFDNGGEFAAHQNVYDELDVKAYFCDPYASWQKGGVENTNGRLRRDLPRNIDILKMKKEDFDETIDNYNTTPRKSLDWLTPLEAFNNNLNSVALQT